MSVLYSLRYIGCALLLSTFSFGAAAEADNYFNCSFNGGPHVVPEEFALFITPSLEVLDDVNLRLTFDSLGQLICKAVSPFYDVYVYMTASELDNSLLGTFRGVIHSPYFESYHPIPVPQPALTFGMWPSSGRELYMRLATELNSDGRPLLETASGIIIKAGQRIASFRYRSVYSGPLDPLYLNGKGKNFYVHVHAKSDVVLPFRACDISSGKVNVTLGDYPRDVSEKEVNLSVKCPATRQVSFSLSGKMLNQTTFANVASSSPATGIGIELLRNGQLLPANWNISMGYVGSQYQSLGLKARYVQYESPVRVGNVQAVIGVNFTYN